MLAKVTKLGFLGLNTTKHEEMKNHYGNVIGLPVVHDASGHTYFSCGNDKTAVSFHKGDKTGYRHVGLQIGGDGPLSDVLAELKAGGVKASIKSDLFQGIGSCIEIVDIDGHAIYLYRSAEPAKNPYASTKGILPDKLGHLAMYVGNAQKTCQFYTDVLGFRWSDWLGDFFVFMRCNIDHHTMNFAATGKSGMFHVAFELHDLSHLGRSCDILSANGTRIIWGPGRHGIGHNLFTYHKDPDGNVIELIADLDRMSDESLGYYDARPYHSEFPQRPRVWDPADTDTVNLWGTPLPPDFL
jgi:catechol-2,3-dioxygenase